MIGAEGGQALLAKRLLNDDQRHTGLAGGLVYAVDHCTKIIAPEIMGDDADRSRLL
jgi:hypothetical protein